MKAKTLLVGLLSVIVSQSVYADIDIVLQNQIDPSNTIDLRLCVGENNCTDWIMSSELAYNQSLPITKVGLASDGYLSIEYYNYRTRSMRSGAVKLPQVLDQYNGLTITLTVKNEKSVILFAPGVISKLELPVLGG